MNPDALTKDFPVHVGKLLLVGQDLHTSTETCLHRVGTRGGGRGKYGVQNNSPKKHYMAGGWHFISVFLLFTFLSSCTGLIW